MKLGARKALVDIVSAVSYTDINGKDRLNFGTAARQLN